MPMCVKYLGQILFSRSFKGLNLLVEDTGNLSWMPPRGHCLNYSYQLAPHVAITFLLELQSALKTTWA